MTRILVVEDEPGIALALDADLAMEGYQVEIAGDGTSACRRAAEGGFDLILLDLMLPGMDGFEVCRRLRRGGLRTPIIILTARTRPAEMVMGLDLGADDYVTKPFSPETLRARIRAVLRRASGAQDEVDVYRFGDAEVDFARCELRRKGQIVHLTSTEYKILAAFIRNRGRVLSRDALLDAAWGHGFAVTDRAVDNHVMALRRKIEPDPDAPRYLVNVRGLGYRFDG
jgi:two-component system alkaline phosphatase synthesis response regulator PhoP